MVLVRSSRAYEFACHSAACAPPPAGKGGSTKGGGRSGAPVRPNPIGPGARSNPNQGMINKTIKAAESKAKGEVKASDLKSGDRVHFAQKVRVVSSTQAQKNGKVGISFKDGGITDLRPGQTLPRAANKVSVPRTTWKNNQDRTTTTNQSDLTKRMARLKEGDTGLSKAPKPDKKWAMSPNNPKNHQRHPDDDRPRGARWKNRKPWTEAVGSKSWTETG